MITREQWDRLSDKARWDIKVALRGPDVQNSDPIKFYTSAVVRGECRRAFRVGGMVNERLRLITLPDHWPTLEKKSVPPYFIFDGSHFLQHMTAAAYWLTIPLLVVPFEKWVGLISTRYPNYSLLKELAADFPPALEAIEKAEGPKAKKLSLGDVPKQYPGGFKQFLIDQLPKEAQQEEE